MSKILFVSYRPPQLMAGEKIEAAHYRAWQFIEPLVKDGHIVRLCAGLKGESDAVTSLPPAWAKQISYTHIPFGQRGWLPALQSAHDHFQPDCIVAVNFSHCLYASRLRSEKPVWMDIYGDMLTIMQASFYRAGSNRGLHTSIAFARDVLATGDVFSVCGTPQQHMTAGQLSMLGRLNRQTFGYPFVKVVLPGAPETSVSTSRNRGMPRPLLASQGISPKDIVVLWCGGYNTWTDVDSLMDALEPAMTQVPHLCFASVGASTYAAPESMYDRLLKRIAASPHRQRFHMLGWRPWSEIPAYLRESDIGVNIDAMHYETIYGTRTRLVEMIAAGLPVVTSTGAELATLLDQNGAGLTFVSGHAESFSDQLVRLATDDLLRKNISAGALRYAQHGLSFAETTKPVREWVNQPQHAPDKVPTNIDPMMKQLTHRMRSVARRAQWSFMGKDK
jgi:glycosyltransferase involved in cell wall biosynthesis